MSSWFRGKKRQPSPGHRPKHHRKRPISAGIEALEQRAMMSADPFTTLLAYDSGAEYIDGIWFQTLSTSNAARANSGQFAVEQATGSIQWQGKAVDVYMDEWIVQLTRESAAQIQQFNQVVGLFEQTPLGIEVIGGTGLTGQLLIRASGVDAAQLGQWLDGQSFVAYYEPNAILPLGRTSSDPSLGQTWALNNTGQTINGQAGVVDADIDAFEAWDITTGSRNVVVGIIDTGIDYTHPDLAANMWRNPGEIAGNGIDDDGNGFVDDVYGWDFVNNDSDPMDDHGHGTHVAGTIAAVGDNATGTAGVAWSAQLMALKFLSGTGSGSLYDAVRAINYATMMRTRYGVNVLVTNNSWGGGGYNQSLRDAIAAHGQAGILFVAAAGNNSSNNDTTPSYPAGYNLDNVLSVAATDNRDQLASFSNYGANTVHLAAPGVSILSARAGGGYQYMSGTSMATPHVTGAAVLCWALDPAASVQQVRNAILGGVDRISSLSGKTITGGRLNARGALDQMGLRVVSASPQVGSTVADRPTQFTIAFSHDLSASSVQASDLTVNGIAANSFTWVNSRTVVFHFNSSPVTAQGPQTMRIASGAVSRSGSGAGFTGWQAQFFHDLTPMAATSVTPTDGATVSAAPTSITFVFNEAVAAASVGIDDLVLSNGTVTAATLVNANTVRYTVSIPNYEGIVTYTLQAGALTDAFGNPSSAYTGRFTIDDPAVIRYSAAGLPLTIPDLGTVTSLLTIADNYRISDVDVELTITHTWNADLDVFLIAPDGTRVELFTDVGGNGQGFTGTILDDQAAVSITAGTPPFTGRYRPEGSLAALVGKYTAGTWKLEIADDAQYDTGVLVSWALQFRVVRGPQLTAPADVTVPRNTPTIVAQAQANPGDGGAVSYSVSAIGTQDALAYQLVTNLGLFAEPSRVAANYYYNYYGMQEKWVRGANDLAYLIMPNGELRRHEGSLQRYTVMAHLDPRYYSDPGLLLAAGQNTVSVNASVDASGRVSITPPSGFVGQIVVNLTAQNSAGSDTKSFVVRVVNQTPTLAPIADQTISHTAGSFSLQLAATDADGDSLSYQVSASVLQSNPIYELRQSLGLFAEPSRVAANYYYNYYGMQEKWVRGANDLAYLIMPNGELRRHEGSLQRYTVMAHLDPRYYSDPGLLINAEPTETPVAASIDAQGRLTVTPPSGFVGDIRVRVTATDGAATAAQSFTLHVVNQAPTLAPIADQTISHTAGSFSLQPAATDADGDPLTYQVSASTLQSNPIYELRQSLGFFAEPSRVAANYYYNYYGLQEKWVRGANNYAYLILPNGELRRHEGSLQRYTVVANLDPRYYADPGLLINAEPTETPVPATIDAQGRLTVTPPSGFVGDIRVRVTATDGAATAAQSFTLHVVNQAPTLAPIADQTISHTAGSFSLQPAATDADGDPLTYQVSASTLQSNPIYELRQSLGLFAEPSRVAANYYYNYYGLQEKWVRGANNYTYLILPNGELRRHEGSLQRYTVVANLDLRYYADPGLLVNAEPTETPVAATIDAQGRLTVTPPAGFVGSIRVVVSAGDGAATVSRQFTLNVVGAATTGSAADSTPAGSTTGTVGEMKLDDQSVTFFGGSDGASSFGEPSGPIDAAGDSDHSGSSSVAAQPAAWAGEATLRLVASHQAIVAARSSVPSMIEIDTGAVTAVPVRLSAVLGQGAIVAMPQPISGSTHGTSELTSRGGLRPAVAVDQEPGWATAVRVTQSFLSPTALVRKTELGDPRVLQPLLQARVGGASRFSQVADRFFADLESDEAVELRFAERDEAPIWHRSPR